MDSKKQALQNFADEFNLKVETKHFYDDGRKKPKFVLIKNGVSISRALDYDGINNFLFGMLAYRKNY
jgi:hypothetical protein